MNNSVDILYTINMILCMIALCLSAFIINY